MTPLVWIGVALLGGVGASARFWLDGFVSERISREFPWGTLVVNLSGAVALGFIAGLALSGNALILAGTATVGAYTTFSTWMFESHRIAEDGRAPVALLNIGISIALGLDAVVVGRVIGGG
jgi:CrcB protein